MQKRGIESDARVLLYRVAAGLSSVLIAQADRQQECQHGQRDRKKALLGCISSALVEARPVVAKRSPRRRRALKVIEIVTVRRHRCAVDACATKKCVQWR